MRARAHTETSKSGRKSIVITEIPYQLNRDNILERMAELVKDDILKAFQIYATKATGEGSRLVIDLKKGEDEEVVLNQLYKHTKLQDSFSIIMIGLINNRPGNAQSEADVGLLYRTPKSCYCPQNEIFTGEGAGKGSHP